MEGWIVILLYVAVSCAVMLAIGIYQGKKLAKPEINRLRAELAQTKDVVSKMAWDKPKGDVILPTYKKE